MNLTSQLSGLSASRPRKLPPRPGGVGKGERMAQAAQLFATHARMTTSEVADALGISTLKARHALNRLAASHKLARAGRVPHGNTHQLLWILVDAPK